MPQREGSPDNVEALVSLHSASTISSVSEISERLQSEADSSSATYSEEQFEPESDEDRESAVDEGTVLDKSSDSSSDNYASDEFEDDQDAIATVVTLGTVTSSDGGGENDYGSESFELEDDQHEATMSNLAINANNFDSQYSGELYNGNAKDKLRSVQGDKSICHEPLNSQLGNWCTDKVKMLNDTKVASRSPVQTVIKLPATTVTQLMTQVIDSPYHHNSPQPNRNAWQHRRQKIRIPDPLVQRAQTQLWLSKFPSNDTTINYFIVPEKATASDRPVMSTFCSTKKEKLLGQLATRQMPKAIDRWMTPKSNGFNIATLEFVQNMTTKQREINAAAMVSDGPGGRVMHRLALAARLQLEESISLRHQAAFLLGQAE